MQQPGGEEEKARRESAKAPACMHGCQRPPPSGQAHPGALLCTRRRTRRCRSRTRRASSNARVGLAPLAPPTCIHVSGGWSMANSLCRRTHAQVQGPVQAPAALRPIVPCMHACQCWRPALLYHVLSTLAHRTLSRAGGAPVCVLTGSGAARHGGRLSGAHQGPAITDARPINAPAYTRHLPYPHLPSHILHCLYDIMQGTHWARGTKQTRCHPPLRARSIDQAAMKLTTTYTAVHVLLITTARTHAVYVPWTPPPLLLHDRCALHARACARARPARPPITTS